jgi:hypothetical protein
MSPDDDLRRLIEDAVSDVEPRDRRIELLAAVHRPSTGRRWLWPVTGGALVAAAVIVAVVVSTGGVVRDQDAPVGSSTGPGRPTATATAANSPSDAPSVSLAPGEAIVPAYYVVPTERAGMRLVREFHRVTTDNPLLAALQEVVETGPQDPDYLDLWPDAPFIDDAAVLDGTIRVALDPAMARQLRQPVPGTSWDQARAALQELVYTAQGAVGQRLPVVFTAADEPVTLLGQDTADGLTAASPLEVLNHANITEPADGRVVTKDTLAVTGVGTGFEATIAWELRRLDDGGRPGEVVRKGATTVQGDWMSDRLLPFAFDVDLAGLPAGRYRIGVTTDDPTGGTEGIGAMTDDKDITVR